LLAESLVLDEQTLRLSEESAERAPPGKAGSTSKSKPSPNAPTEGTTPGLFVPRVAGSRPRAGLGKARGAPTTGTQSEPAAPTVSAKSLTDAPGAGKGQDDFRKLLSGGK
jgi:hypothetical protein